ncbi:hypothetical protein F8B73_06915 [Listeria monocytogenes]|nr:hypothetical protein [Listeria monocytogenes]
MVENRVVVIEITKNVYWDNWGRQQLVFKKGWVGNGIAHYKEGILTGVAGESPLDPQGVTDKIWEGHYKILDLVN